MSEAQKKLSEVSIRMYRPGLGDCFLLSFKNTTGQVHQMLIDCGVLQGSKGASERMRKIAADILKTTSGHLHTVVATHEHWDHLSGFRSARNLFGLNPKRLPANPVTVDQVWMAWTENPEDEDVIDIRQRQRKMSMAISAAALGMGAAEAKPLSQLLEFSGIFMKEPLEAGSAPASGTAQAEGGGWLKGIMDDLRAWGDKDPRFLEPDDVLELDDFGVKVYVLGPARELFRRGKDKGSSAAGEKKLSLNQATAFLAAAVKNADLGLAEEDEDGLTRSDLDELYRLSQPFDESLAIRLKEIPSHPSYGEYFEKYYRFDPEANYDQAWRRIDQDWLQMAETFALQQVSTVNNTSLVLAFDLTESGKVLLFPGDAEEESWEHWGCKGTQCDDLFKRTVFYKVGHHGSVNATVIQGGLDRMTSPELVAMIPVDRDRAQENEWNFPEQNLHKELKKRTGERLILNCEDKCPTCEPTYPQAKFASGSVTKDSSKDKLWVEYTIKV